MQIRKQLVTRFSALCAALLLGGCLCTESPEANPGAAQPSGPQPKNRREAQKRGVPDPTVTRSKRGAAPAAQSWHMVGRGSWRAGPALSEAVTPLEQVVKEPGSFKGKRVRVKGEGRRCGSALLLESQGKLLIVQPPLPIVGEAGKQVDTEGEVSTEAGLRTARSECPEAARAVALMIASSVMIGSGSR